jgi:hypothetical protein
LLDRQQMLQLLLLLLLLLLLRGCWSHVTQNGFKPRL